VPRSLRQARPILTRSIDVIEGKLRQLDLA
jgi:hypothetical protein